MEEGKYCYTMMATIEDLYNVKDRNASSLSGRISNKSVNSQQLLKLFGR